MTQEKIKEVEDKMKQALLLIMEAAELSIPLVQQNGKAPIKALWEDFLREFIRYARKKSKETGVDLISLVSLTRIIR